MMEDRFAVLLFRTCLVGCLLGIVATIYFLLGLAGYVGSPLLNLFVAASLVAASIFFLKAFIGALGADELDRSDPLAIYSRHPRN